MPRSKHSEDDDLASASPLVFAAARRRRHVDGVGPATRAAQVKSAQLRGACLPQQIDRSRRDDGRVAAQRQVGDADVLVGAEQRDEYLLRVDDFEGDVRAGLRREPCRAI